ncbi:hypothetical protein VTP01DRAFT_4890 [Rhizomucor pusillus]|uniref:uncharacterized protein n=1 Tax=Rhizomucor pusillus TaxID=4840 RepID=UPI00374310E0
MPPTKPPGTRFYCKCKKGPGFKFSYFWLCSLKHPGALAALSGCSTISDAQLGSRHHLCPDPLLSMHHFKSSVMLPFVCFNRPTPRVTNYKRV